MHSLHDDKEIRDSRKVPSSRQHILRLGHHNFLIISSFSSLDWFSAESVQLPQTSGGQ